MSYRELSGNLFTSKAHALVNTVNCMGVMGRGIALEFRRRFPRMFLAYQKDCQQGKLKPGYVYPYPEGDRLILNFAIKLNWKYPSKTEWIESCLQQFVSGYKRRGIVSVAFPWMGAESGKLALNEVQTITRKYLQNLEDIDIEIYSFDPDAYDPLFETLKMIAFSKDPESYLLESGLQKDKYLQIVDSIKLGVAKNFTSLLAVDGIGTKTMDNLYQFLIEYPSVEESTKNKGEEKAIQLSIWND